jgi:hypothetical protein
LFVSEITLEIMLNKMKKMGTDVSSGKIIAAKCARGFG